MPQQKLTPELLLSAYCSGVFPMSEHRSSHDIFWLNPQRRGVFPIGRFHISRSLRRALLKGDYKITINTAFLETVDACANREETWINAPIRSIYNELHQNGYAHSLEVWREQDLIGGLYGVCIGAAFFGESMFSYATNGSKIALSYLLTKLDQDGFSLFDTQFITPHLASLGAIEISRDQYIAELNTAVHHNIHFKSSRVPSVYDVLQPSNHTS